MIWKTAWRNVWRNKTRSLVVIISVTIGIFAGIFSVAVMNGAIDQRVYEALNNEIAHFQLNHKDFRSNNDVKFTIDNVDDVIAKINNTEGVVSACKRTLITGMANTATKSTGVQILGVDPSDEKEVLSLYKELLPETGNYFENYRRPNVAYIGESLAKELNIIRYTINQKVIDSLKMKEVPGEVVSKLEPYMGKRFKSEKLFRKELKSVFTKSEAVKYGRLISNEAKTFRKGAKITLTFQDIDNNQTGGMFRIGGLYDINNNMFEQSQVFVLNSELQSLTGVSGDVCHQVVVKINDIENTKLVHEKLKASFPELEVLSWKEIQPDLAMMSEMMTQVYGVLMVIILAALAFGIVNTMLMVVLERTKELGMLTAIGMNRKRVFKMIMLESVFLSLIGGVIGMVISKLLISLTSASGINLAGYEEGFEAMGFSALIYPVIGNAFFIVVAFLIVITGILSSIYPALKALKLNPADAIRTE